MITIKATINILGGDNESIRVEELENVRNTAKLSEVIGSTAKGGNPLLLGVTPLGTHPTLNSSVPFFIYDKDFHSQYINLTFSNPVDNLSIKFDTYNNMYPQNIEIRVVETGETFYYSNDDPYFTVKFPNLVSGTVQVYLGDWNSDYPIRIESISVGMQINIDKRNMLSYNGIIQKKADEKMPSWGIVSTTGNLSFNDTNGEIGDYADENILIKDLNVEVDLVNTLTKKVEKIGVFKTDTWDYDNNSREVSVSLKDDLTEWQDIFVEGFSYDPRKLESISAYDLYDYIQKRTPDKYKMLSRDELNQTTQNILKATIVPYKLLNDGNLWEQWTKLCELCACHIYKLKNGNTTFAYGG